ncbi:MAG TPA: Glu/Leu/Phe/Val dehydrogenase dimerization domain-containing protein [Steroidobacter sp.]|jgi:leucine dehydrogenase|nr:Glu/Leu/Phe/Val dehydrogenase dimerization domain-containing protein [Steroidobacteraceae bacterium]HLS81129.1 Glu/Leu/Phe/Val dehydrogenase dimerization domain-containing protein [Steroidobacter sp.]
MNLFETVDQFGHEQVAFFHDRECGLRCVIAIHSTVLGPALGGVRMWPYANEADAVRDVLRHSQDMTYKAAVAGLNLGGAKAVLIGDPETGKSEALLRALGRYIHSLGGRYIAAEDVGTNSQDMDQIRLETRHVVGVSPENGGGGDPSRFTALGALHGIRACLEHRYGHADLHRVSFAVQGAGQVGYHLAKLLCEAGAKVFITDIAEDRVEQAVNDFGAEAVPMSQIYDVDADVFSPCALGAVINEDTLPRLRCRIVAGGANNQLESPELGDELDRRGILYAPDYAINAGGLMNSALELEGYSQERAIRDTARIHDVITRILQLSERSKIPTWQAARRLAEERIAALGRIKLPWSPRERSG